jgi:hypothetical protein
MLEQNMSSLFQSKISVYQNRCYAFLFKIHSTSSLLTPNRINDKLVIDIKLGEKN